VWEAIFDLVKDTSEVLPASLPTFWKISKNFMEGKYKKVWFGVVNGTAQCLSIETCVHSHRRQGLDEARANAVLWRLTVSDFIFP
jgi:hypothetical protein